MSTTEGADRTAIRQTEIVVDGERRQASVLFADIVGFTALVEREGEEAAFVVERMVYDILAGAVRARGGVVRGFAGDSVMAVYGIPET